MNDKLSICITVKNRSKVETEHGILELFPKCLQSINNSITDMKNIDIVISDWESTDYPILQWIDEVITEIPTEVITIKTKDNTFSAGMGRNIAANRAKGDIILFLDADILINNAAFYNGWEVAKQHEVCYPVIMYQKDYKSEEHTVHEGGGILYINKELFYKVGKWPEYYSHGFEDTDFAKKLSQFTKLYTSNLPFYHQWHPQSKDWKNRYAKNIDQKVEQRRQYYKNETDNQIENWFGNNFNQIMNNTSFNKR